MLEFIFLFFITKLYLILGFPGGATGKETVC